MDVLVSWDSVDTLTEGSRATLPSVTDVRSMDSMVTRPSVRYDNIKNMTISVQQFSTTAPY